MIAEFWIASFLVGDIEKDKKGYFYVQIDFGLRSRKKAKEVQFIYSVPLSATGLYGFHLWK